MVNQERGTTGEAVDQAECHNHVSSCDFLEGRSDSESRLSILTILDEFTQECLRIPLGRSI